MRLSQPLSYPKPPQDFYTEQMRKLSRDTSNMIIHMLDMIPKNKSDMYVELNSMLTADWDDSLPPGGYQMARRACSPQRHGQSTCSTEATPRHSMNYKYLKGYFSLSCECSLSSAVSRSPLNRDTSDNHLSEKPKTVAFPKALNRSSSELAESTSRDFWKTPGINTSTH